MVEYIVHIAMLLLARIWNYMYIGKGTVSLFTRIATKKIFLNLYFFNFQFLSLFLDSRTPYKC